MGKQYEVGGELTVMYAYSLPNSSDHKGMLKVGMTTVKASTIEEASEILQKRGIERIKEQLNTSGVKWVLEHVELAVRETPRGLETFDDHAVHQVLKNSGFKRHKFEHSSAQEWFEDITVEDVKQAIYSYKNGDTFIPLDSEPIVLYPHQELAVKETLKTFGAFGIGRTMLWAAKPRFGKTIGGYELVKQTKADKVLILTHRPDVNDAWFSDFKKMKMHELGYKYASKANGDKTFVDHDKLIQFVSLQDLRGSGVKDGEELSKNEEIFRTEWDLVIGDEVHEGWLTELASDMLKNLKFKKQLHLSGTAYNVSKASTWEYFSGAKFFDYDGVFTWDYIDEQKAKKQWKIDHPSLPNPYDKFPEIVIMGFDIQEILEIAEEDGTLAALTNEGKSPTVLMSKLFATNKKGKFIHERLVLRLLRKIIGDPEWSDNPEAFPFHSSYDGQFRHTLWILPNVPAVNALEKLLKEEVSGFSEWTIVNATGEGNAEASSKALERVRESVKKSRSIVLTQQMLLTGISVPEWTAVFQLNDSTSAIRWMQSSLRASTPGLLHTGQQKQKFYVFDFSPTRILKTIDEVAKARAPKEEDPTERAKNEAVALEELLEYIPINTYKEGKFVELDSETVIHQLNELVAMEVADSGFTSPKIFNNIALSDYSIEKKDILNALRRIQGSGSTDNSKEIEASADPKAAKKNRERLAELEKKAKAAAKDKALEKLSEEEKKERAELRKTVSREEKAERRNRANAIKILAGISCRIPLAVFAAPPDATITVDNFNLLLDDESWAEFMPPGLERIKPEGIESFEKRSEKALSIEGETLYWGDIARFYDANVFKTTCELFRGRAVKADEFGPLDRAVLTRAILDTVKNPDKETVLTPGRVVDLHYSSTLGGLVFTDLDSSTSSETFILLREVETGKRDSVLLSRVPKLLEAGSHELAPVWVKSTGEVIEVPKILEESAVETILDDEFWTGNGFNALDLNSKTALYPLFGAVSRFFVESLMSGVDPFGNTTEAWSLYEQIVSERIFANVRVPYSRRIAQRVLVRGDSSVVVNSTVIDLVKFRKVLEWWNNRCGGSFLKKEAPEWWSVYDVDEVFGKVLGLASPAFLEFTGVSAGFARVMSDRVVELLKNIDKMELGLSEGDGLSALRELLGLVSETVSEFGAIVGNPPYQVNIEVSSANKAIAISVYPDFFKTAFKAAKKVSIISPARWFNSPDAATRSAREEIVSNGYDKNFQKIFYYEDSESVFPSVSIGGGIAFWSFDKGYNGETEFFVENVSIGEKELVSSDGLVNIDFNLSGIKDAIADNKDYEKSNPVLDWLNGVQNAFLLKFKNASTQVMLDNTSSERVNTDDVALRIPRHGTRYAPKEWFNDKNSVPKGKYAITFSHASHARNKHSLNDRTDFLIEGESSKSTMAVLVDSLDQFINVYKYSRTKLFKLLVEGRLSSHNTYPQAYQDVPWWFKFDETDPINWDGSIPEIDAELEAYLGLEEFHDYIQKVEKPFASALDASAKALLKKELLKQGSEKVFTVDELDEWY